MLVYWLHFDFNLLSCQKNCCASSELKLIPGANLDEVYVVKLSSKNGCNQAFYAVTAFVLQLNDTGLIKYLVT